jgi:hypothetical protein
VLCYKWVDSRVLGWSLSGTESGTAVQYVVVSCQPPRAMLSWQISIVWMDAGSWTDTQDNRKYLSTCIFAILALFALRGW